MLRRNLLGLVAATSLSFPACGSGASLAHRSHLPTDPRGSVAPGEVAIAGVGFEVHAVGRVDRAALRQAWAGVLATMSRYLEAGVLIPLRSGGPAADLTTFFTAEAGQRLASAPSERAALVDEGLPPATGIAWETAVARLTALVDDQGTVGAVSALLDVRINAEVDGGPLKVTHTGELVLMPDGDTWKIDAFEVRATRDSAGSATTTTARS